MKGIILAGGAGSRLYPTTHIMSKQLLPIYDKPLIYYPLGTLMMCDIKEFLIITTPHDLPHFQKLLGDGTQWGINIQYKEQSAPRGIPEAFILGEEFIGNDDVTLILGDNLFYGDLHGFRSAYADQKNRKDGTLGRIFAYRVNDPERYGVIEFDKNEKVLSIEEKPQKPKSNYAIPGLYLLDSSAVMRAKNIKPSARGETEIVELIKSYQAEGKLGVTVLGRGLAWLDTGTPRSMLEAGQFVGAIEQRQGLKISCLEEIAYRMKFIDKQKLEKIIEKLPSSEYQQYLKLLLTEV